MTDASVHVGQGVFDVGHNSPQKIRLRQRSALKEARHASFTDKTMDNIGCAT